MGPGTDVIVHSMWYRCYCTSSYISSNVLEFCNELAKLLETNINLSGELMLLGDFNIAVNKPLDAVPASFLDVLHSFNLTTRVDKPTHRLCNTLDLIIHDAD